MFSEERSLRALCEREVNGKKRSISQMGRWSKEEHSLRALCHLDVTGKKRSERVFKRWSREERSLRALCHLDVTGKKRSERVFKRWSSEHNWQERVAAYDADVERAAYQELLAQRQAEVEAFIEEDMAISLKFQKLCSTKKSSSVRNRLSRAKKNLKTWAIAWEEAYTEGYDLKFSEFMENQKKKK